MRLLLICVILSHTCFAQQRFKELLYGDSVIFYQCHVEEAAQQITTVSGQTISSSPEKYSITEKFVIVKDSGFFKLRHFTSSILVLPNRKFSGLKIRERSYWNFKLQKDTIIKFNDLRPFAEIESKGRETTEYDFAITKYTTNQIIIKSGKRFRQLVLEENIILSKRLFG